MNRLTSGRMDRGKKLAPINIWGPASAYERTVRSSLLCRLATCGGGSTWESLGSAVVAQIPLLPGFACTQADTLDGCITDTPSTGGITALGNYAGMYGELRYRYATANEQACVGAAAQTDTDGDGLAGCNDADCWWACTPACPAGMSCP